jgi:hypothetical protein
MPADASTTSVNPTMTRRVTRKRDDIDGSSAAPEEHAAYQPGARSN